MGGIRNLDDQGGRLLANIAARNSGLRSKDAHPGQAGGLLRKTYLCKGTRCIAASAVLHERGLYNGAKGDVVDIAFRWAIPRRRRPPPSSSLADGPEVAPIAPIDRLLDCRRRCSRLMITLAPALVLRFARARV